MPRRLCAFLCACLFGLCLAAPALAAAKMLTVSFEAVTYPNRARTLLKNINAYRRENGLAALVMLSDLEKASVQRAAELFVLFDHDRPDLTEYDSAAAPYASLKKCQAVSECIAAGYSKAEDVFADWKKNASSALLDADFTHAGLACVYVKGSANEYYWELLLQQQPADVSAKRADGSAKAGTVKKIRVEIAKGMYERADQSHRRFELRADDLTLKTKTTAQVSVSLYDRYGVKIGKCDPADLTYKSSDPSLFAVSREGVVTKKKNGAGTLTLRCAGLEDATCKVTLGNASAGVTAATIGEAEPELTAKAYTRHAALSVYLKGASGYVLYRSASKAGPYAKVEETATTQRWTYKLDYDGLDRAYYYKVRAYKNSGGKRVYSRYSEAVRIKP